MLRIAIAATVLFTAQTAQAADCKSIQDPAARLACFDAAPKASTKKTTLPKTDEFAVAKAAMARKLSDPESARWQDLFKARTSDGEVVCGMVNSKNRMGGYAGAVGFIYEPRLSRATQMFSGATDPEYNGASAAAYCTYCVPDPRSDKNIEAHCPSLMKSYSRP